MLIEAGQIITDGTVRWRVRDIKSGGGVPIGTVMPFLATQPQPGWLALDTGAMVGRATYPQLWAWVQANAPLISEAEWQAQAAVQSSVGFYSSGDGSTTFRLPRILDYPRGGLAANVGQWQGDAIRNITGGSFNGGREDRVLTHGTTFTNGAFKFTNKNANLVASGNGVGIGSLEFDASLVVPTADENRPKTIKFLFCVKAFDAITDQGFISTTELANEVAGKQKVLAYIKIWDEKPSGTHGGTFTAGGWRTRDLNKKQVYGISPDSVTLASNQITLPPGVYIIRASAPTCNVNGHKIRLRNITENTTLLVGTTEQGAAPGNTDWMQTRSELSGTFTIAISTVLEIQHYSQETFASYGFGTAISTGEVEVYTVLELQKIG